MIIVSAVNFVCKMNKNNLPVIISGLYKQFLLAESHNIKLIADPEFIATSGITDRSFQVEI